MSTICDVVILGAGPYGLSAAAHFRAAGVNIQVFGRPMEFWERQMPQGMLLRSSWDACHFSDPRHELRLEEYQAKANVALGAPVSLNGFIGYGRWFQRQVVPDVDPRRAARIEPAEYGFRITLEDSEIVNAKRVVVATGISRFAHLPPEFAGAACHLVSHSSEHRDLGRFAGGRVMVVGGGQSAIESAAILSEHGADVEVISRAPEIRWLERSSRLHKLPKKIRRIIYHSTDVGPALLSQLVARPNLFRRLSRDFQDRLAYRSIRPAASAWLRPRVAGVRFTTGRRVAAVKTPRNSVNLHLDDGTTREADHVLLATGYKIDIARYHFIPPELIATLSTINGYPKLGPGLESSMPGLHFLGAPAAYSFGPLMRFVSGTAFASQSLTQRVIGRA